MPGPLLTVYYASKAYVLSFSEALDEELKGSGVSVTCLCPGPIATGFQARADMQNSKLVKGRTMMSVSEVAKQGIEALERRQRIVIPGLMNQIQALAPRFVPRSLMPWIVKRVQSPSSV
jgi:hypothetical protein